MRHGGRQEIPYRPHLDGLRGVAILLVVLYHVGIPGFEGGFVGVDVFFVLSGYLIFSLIRREIEVTGRVSWTAFFGRRAARLLPAALLLVMVLSVSAVLLLSPVGERQQAAKSMLAALASAGNVYYWKLAPADYFAPVQGPGALMLHTWSLGIEEQFYLLLPLGVLLANRLARRWGISLLRMLWVLLLIGTAASVAVAVWLAQTHPSAGFYMLPARAYELGAGALLALSLSGLPRSRAVQRWAAVAGVLALVLILVLDVPSESFPGAWALLPVTGALGLILGSTSVAVLRLLLESRPLVQIGRVSYGWYLWHWPLLVLADVIYVAPAPLSWRVMAVLAALALAVASHRWWEVPLRQRGRLRPATALLVGGTATVAVALVPLGVGAQAKFVGPTGSWESLRAMQEDFAHIPQQCLDPEAGEAAAMRMASTRCIVNATDGSRSRPRIVVWGDSHAWAWLPAVIAAAGDRARVEDATYPGCPPGVTSVADSAPEAVQEAQSVCASSNREVLDRLDRAHERVDVVVVAARWSVQLGAQPFSLLDRDAISADNDWRLDPSVVRQQVRSAVRAAVSAGAHVLVVRPVPELRRPAPACLRSFWTSDDCDERVPEQVRFAEDANRFLSSLARRRSVDILDPTPFMCDEHTCPAEADGVVRYFDDDHISASFSRSLAPLFRAHLDSWLDAADHSHATHPVTFTGSDR